MPTGVQPPIGTVRAAVARALEEDLTPLGHITSGLLPDGIAGWLRNRFQRDASDSPRER